MRVLENRDETEKRKSIARNQIKEQLIQLSPVLAKNKFLMGDDFTMLKYAESIFARPAFIDSMTPSEKVMRR